MLSRWRADGSLGPMRQVSDNSRLTWVPRSSYELYGNPCAFRLHLTARCRHPFSDAGIYRCNHVLRIPVRLCGLVFLLRFRLWHILALR